MLFEVNLPSLSPTMEEGKIVKWIKSEKQQVLSGEVLFEVTFLCDSVLSVLIPSTSAPAA